jgi:hypothetical protein
VLKEYMQGTISKRTTADALRHLISRSETPLVENGYLDENIGATVKSISHWKSQRRETDVTARFDRFVVDCLEVSLAFDILYHGGFDTDDINDLLSTAQTGTFGSSCETNTAKTLEWLYDYDVSGCRNRFTEEVLQNETSTTESSGTESEDQSAGGKKSSDTKENTTTEAGCQTGQASTGDQASFNDF